MKKSQAPDAAVLEPVRMRPAVYSRGTSRRGVLTSSLMAWSRPCDWSVAVWTLVELPWETGSDTSQW
jgi:hypothetical protein